MNPSLSVIVAYYKNLTFLNLLLKAFNKQSRFDFEVILAEDDNENETKLFLSNFNAKFVIKHVFQEDKGFRKCKILNEAVKVSDAPFLVFIDGDCIPHHNFIAAYFNLSYLECVFGRRVMLSEQHTNMLINSKSNLSFWSLLVNKSKKLKHAVHLPQYPIYIANDKGIWGCNWGISKKNLIEINGFDEDYNLAGIGEDVDVQWRLQKSGVKVHYTKHRAIVFHLHHKVHYNDEVVQKGLAMLKHKMKLGNFRCLNGLNKAF